MGKIQIKLIILSPSPAVNKLTFEAIPTATTIAELREQISAAVTTHPAPDRQRLIYRGHALIDANKTLRDVFTPDVIESSDTLSLHLVLPPETSPHPGAAASTPRHSDLVRNNNNPQHVDASSNNGSGSDRPQSRTQAVGGPQAPNSQNATLPPLSLMPHAHGHIHNTMPPGQIPPQLQQTFAQLHAVNQQLATQLAAMHGSQRPSSASPNQALPNQSQTQPLQQLNPPQPLMQNVMVQMQIAQQQMAYHQQQMRAMRRDQVNSSNPNHYATANEQPLPSEVGAGRSQVGAQSAVQAPNPPHGNTNTVIRENNGPNEERCVVIRDGPANNTIQNQSAAAPSSAFFGTNSPQHAASAHNEGSSSHGPTRHNMPHHASHLRERQQSPLVRAALERAASHRATEGSESTAVYILSSPSGPHALLISPSGLYTTPWHLPAYANINPHSLIGHPQPIITHTSPGTQSNPANSQQPQVDLGDTTQGQAQQPADGAPIAQAQEQQQVNQIRDLARIILPLGGHVWLLIRLFGFVYFFTAGAGWRRTILLGLIAATVFVAQTGLFRPVIRRIWDPIRRHAEGLVPLAGNEQPRAAPGANVPARGTQPRDREPTPRETAERLLQERQRQNENVLRQSIRRIERAIALFVASLVPGVGERHIAAREATEAARQAEIRETEEQARREEEARRQQEEGTSTENVAAEVSNTADGATTTPSPAVQDQGVQPPLIDV